MDFVYDIENDDFLEELEVAINSFRRLLGRPYFLNQGADTYRTNKEICQTDEFQSVVPQYITNVLQSFHLILSDNIANGDTYVHTCIHTYIHTYMHTCIHTYVHYV